MNATIIGAKRISILHEEPVERNWTAGMAVYTFPNRPSRNASDLCRWMAAGSIASGTSAGDGRTHPPCLTVLPTTSSSPSIWRIANKSRMSGKYWLPGMNAAAERSPIGRFRRPLGLHHPIVHGDTAYCSWRDAGLAVVDVADRANPKLVVHKTWFPPLSGGTHNALPLPDRDLLIVVDEAVLDSEQDGRSTFGCSTTRSGTIQSASRPSRSDRPRLYGKLGGHFGPHNIHENWPNGFQSSELIFATYQNAGLRAYNISNPFQPMEVAASRAAGAGKTGRSSPEQTARVALGRRVRGQRGAFVTSATSRRRALRHRIQGLSERRRFPASRRRSCARDRYVSLSDASRIARAFMVKLITLVVCRADIRES